MKKKIIITVVLLDILLILYIIVRIKDPFSWFSDKVIPGQNKISTVPADTIVPSLEEALAGSDLPESIRENLCVVPVNYMSFDSSIHAGYLITHKELSKDVDSIFQELLDHKFLIGKIVPMHQYNWSDSLSMADNNTSCFNYRNIEGSSRLSDHASGRAIDINPRINPYVKYKTGVTQPEGASYDPGVPGTITSDSEAVAIFKKHGWRWGGDWKYSKDYQHFYKK